MGIFIGPVGGFSQKEIEFAIYNKITPVSLGPRIFRAETAGIIAATAILYEFGDLAGWHYKYSVYFRRLLSLH